MRSWIDGGSRNKKIVTMEMTVDGDLAYSMVAYSEDYDKKDGSVFTDRE